MPETYYKLFGEATNREPDTYATRLCKACYLGEVSFVALLSILGMVIHLIDMWKLIHGKAILTEDLWRNRVQRGKQRFLSVETEKYLKFAFSILYFEHYFFMLLAFLTKESLLLIPWLTMESVVIVLEIVLLFIRLFIEKSTPSKQELIMMLVILYSFLQTYCYQRSIAVMRCPGCLS